MKKFVAILLALMMVCALSVSAFAAEKPGGKFVWWGEVYAEEFATIKQNEDWDAYQAILDALIAEENVYLEIGDVYSISGPADAENIYSEGTERLVSIFDETLFRNEYYADDRTDAAEYMISGKYLWDSYGPDGDNWLSWDWYYHNTATGLYKNIYIWVADPVAEEPPTSGTTPETPETPSETPSESPSTGDPITLYALTALVTAAASGAVLSLKKRS